MEDLLNFLALVVGGYCFIGCFERLGKVNWFQVRPASVLMYLSSTGWSAWIIKDSFTGGLNWYQLLGGIFIICFLWITRSRWKYGAPVEVTRFQDTVIHAHRRKDD